MPTSMPPPTVDGSVRWVYPADQTDEQTEPPVNTGWMDTLFDFAQYPSFPETSQLLSRFDAIQESLAWRDSAQALTDMPSSSIEHPLPLEIPGLIHDGMLTHMETAPVSQANAGVLACMPSSSFQQQHCPEPCTANKRSMSLAAGIESSAGFMSPPTKIARKKVDLQTLRALQAAVAQDPEFNSADWALAHGLNSSTVRKLVSVRGGDLTPEGRSRLDAAEGKVPRLRPVEVDDLRVLSDALARDPKLNVAEWARNRGVNPSTVREHVRGGALTPEAWDWLNRAGGKAPRLPQLGVDDLRALRDALACDVKLSVAGWARNRGLNPSTVREHVRGRALTAHAQRRLDVADGKASCFRPMGVDDLRALRDALARNFQLDVAEWARMNNIHPLTARNSVRDGMLTPEAQNRLNLADGKAPNLRKVEIDDLRALDAALTGKPKFNVMAWARARNLHSATVRKLVRKGALTAEARKRLNLADGEEPNLRRVAIDDLRALDAAMTLDPRVNVTEWGLARGLNPAEVRRFVRACALTPEARKRLQEADDLAMKLGRTVTQAAA
ncbi:hypothetical protein [Pandoraea pulmonicola]|nr:hypothetical protein [Pandoraea pulmonicola]